MFVAAGETDKRDKPNRTAVFHDDLASMPRLTEQIVCVRGETRQRPAFSAGPSGPDEVLGRAYGVDCSHILGKSGAQRRPRTLRTSTFAAPARTPGTRSRCI